METIVCKSYSSNELYVIKTQKGRDLENYSNNFTTIEVEEILTLHKFNSSLLDYDYLKKKYNIKLSNEEVGIFLCHREIWRQFLMSGKDYCLIIEDNVTFSCNVDDLYSSIKDLPSGWDVSFPFDRFEKNNFDKQPYLLKFYWGSCAYFLSKNGATRLSKIDTIRQPIDDEILQLALENKIQIYSGTLPLLKIDFDKAYVHEGRKREISKTIAKYNAWSVSNKTLIRKILAIISQLSHNHGINLILHGGSLLGYVRHGQILPWDDDVDIGIEALDFKNFVEIISEDGRLKLIERFESHTSTFFYKLWLDEGEPIVGYSYKFPFVDIWLYSKAEKNLVFHNGIIFPNVLCRGLESVLFEGSKYHIPQNYLECLDSIYSGWREKIKIYPFCHRLETFKSNSFQTSITTDKKGRFLDYKVY